MKYSDSKLLLAKGFKVNRSTLLRRDGISLNFFQTNFQPFRCDLAIFTNFIGDSKNAKRHDILEPSFFPCGNPNAISIIVRWSQPPKTCDNGPQLWAYQEDPGEPYQMTKKWEQHACIFDRSQIFFSSSRESKCKRLNMFFFETEKARILTFMCGNITFASNTKSLHRFCTTLKLWQIAFLQSIHPGKWSKI